MLVMNGPPGISGLSAWAGVPDDGALAYCKGQWPTPGNPQRSAEQAWAGCVDAIQNGQNPSAVMGQPAGSASGGETPLWQKLLIGTATNLISSTMPGGQGTQPMPYIPPPIPWYKTPIGMGGIVVGALALFVLLKK